MRTNNNSSVQFQRLSPLANPEEIVIENITDDTGDQKFFGFRCISSVELSGEVQTIWYEHMSARAICSSGNPVVIDDVLKCAATPRPVEGSEFPDCDGVNGDKHKASGPTKCVGNPIAIDSGTKQQSEQDYSTADGLLGVSRHYRSRPRTGSILAPSKAKSEASGFGTHWRGLIPGQILVYQDSGTWFAQYYPDTGGVRQFRFTQQLDGSAAFSADYSETRLKLAVDGSPANIASPDELFGGDVGAGGPVNLRLSFANGDYIAFKGSSNFDQIAVRRIYVPIEHGLANGYKRVFAYPDDSEYPAAIQDNLNRQLTINWTDMGWLSDGIPGYTKGPGAPAPQPGMTKKKAVGSIDLPDGTRLVYGYVASSSSGFAGRLKTVQRLGATNQLLWARTYLYEDSRFPDALTGMLDQNGARLSTYAYDSSGRATLTEKTGGFGRNSIVFSTQNSAEGPEDVRTVTSPLGATKKYAYAGFDSVMLEGGRRDLYAPRRLLSMEATSSATASPVTTGYNYIDNMLTGATDGNGNMRAQSNDTQEKRPTSMTDASGTVTTFSWRSDRDLVTQTLRKDLQTDYSYTAEGRLTKVTQRDIQTNVERTTEFTLGLAGRVLAINGPRVPDAQGRDDIVTMTYDAQGNQLTMTNALGHITRFEGYDGNGRPARIIDPNGVVTELGYDSLGRIISTRIKHPTDAARDAVTTMEYDVEGRVIAIQRPDTAKLLFDYNLAGLMTAMRSEDGERIDYTHDLAGNVVTQTVKRADGTQARSMARSFDALGRMISQTLGAGGATPRTMLYQYDNVGNTTRVTSALGNALDQSFDALNRLVQTVAPDGGVARSFYDGMTLDDGSGTQVISPGSGPDEELGAFQDAIGVTTRFVRNAFGEVVEETSPDRGTSSYVYDAGGDLVSMTDGRGQQVAYARDILGRVLSKTPVGRPALEKVTYSYDTPAVTGSFGVGRLSRIDDGTGATRFAWDHRGNLVTRFQKLVGNADWVALRYAHDLADRIELVTYPSGRQVRYVRDGKGRVQSVRTRANNTITTWTNVATNMGYEAFGSLKTMSLGNGERLVASYGDDGRLDGRRLYKLADGTNISHLTYGYDAEDNITRITDRLDAARSQSFAYDAAGRLKRVTTASGAMQRTDYVFDANGNRTRVLTRPLPDDPPTAATTERYVLTSGTNRLQRIVTPNGNRSLTYDARGNLAGETRPGGISVTTAYDGYGRLTGYTRTGEANLTHAYNGMDDRVATTTDGTPASAGAGTRRFVYAPDGRVLGEYGTSAQDVKAEFIWLNPEVGEASGNLFGGDDGLNGYMPLAVAANDNQAQSQLTWVHASHMGVLIRYSDASGNTLPPPTSYSVPGFAGQSRTLADLYYNRHRDYDPVTGRYIQADPIGLAGGPSPYSYAMNNPLRYSDPQGLCLWDGCIVEAVVAGAVIGAGSDLAMQAIGNWWNGRDVFDADCYDWKSVAVSAGLGAAGGGVTAWAGRGVGAAGGLADDVTGVLANQARGNAARDEFADLLRAAGREVDTDVYFPTPFGKRYVDIDVWLDGVQLGGVEVKSGGSRYLPSQRAKDFWLRVYRNYKVELVRLP